MMQLFTRAAAATPKIRVADPFYNAEAVIAQMKEAALEGAKLIVFPELVLTGYTCADLFHQQLLLDAAKKALNRVLAESRGLDMLAVVGLPFLTDGKLYNVAAFMLNGCLLALVPKEHLPNYSEFYELRWFEPGERSVRFLSYTDGDGRTYEVPFGTDILLSCENEAGVVLAAELCEDVWVPNPPSTRHAMAGATVIVNCSASDETVGKDSYRRELIGATSARLVCAYVYANAGEGESSQDLVFGGQNLICENGTKLAESKRFQTGIIYADLDLARIAAERSRMTSFPVPAKHRDDGSGYVTVPFAFEHAHAQACGGAAQACDSAAVQADSAAKAYDAGSRGNGLTEQTGASKKTDAAGIHETAEMKPQTANAGCIYRYIDPHPFVPSGEAERSKRCEEILTIQAMGLKKRLEHTHARSAVIGISGGLDSTLALLVTAKAFDMLGIPRADITCVTMPCFGTTDRTYQNAVQLTKHLGASLREVNIRAAVMRHFEDIGHDPADHSVTYENSQARERTQILMDIANQTGGLVIGTGDMSELALGWATYNGDHMSMYAVNVGVPKTLVRHLVQYDADMCKDKALAACLYDVLDTPVSPELLPPEDGKISQKTEDLVGPYELHDFFLYQVLRYGYAPKRVFALAVYAFGADTDTPVYDRETILKWLKTFYRRFFSQQFKRSCLPDGPKVGSAAVSPRGDLRMPSDAVSALWLAELEEVNA